jgi:hypothetical protein
MFTRKDFIETANDIILVAKGYPNNTKLITNLTKVKCEEFKKSNKRFDEKRFREYIEVGIYGNKV